MIIGILQKATDAKTNTERKKVIESARIDILGQQAENKGENISKEQLTTILNKHFETVDKNSIPDEISSTNDIGLTTKDEKYKINLSEIYFGKLTNDDCSVTASKINSHIGDTINYVAPQTSGYTGNWQIFYATDSELFIISSNVADTIDGDDALTKKIGNETTYSYEGSKDLRNNYLNHRNDSGAGYDYGSRYNSRWLASCQAAGYENEGANGKYTAYLCDPDNWQQYVTGKASYAVGGPTLELIELSTYQTTGNENIIGSAMTWVGGYSTPNLDGNTYIINQDFLCNSTWTLASPHDDSDTVYMMMFISSENEVYGEYLRNVRPLVSIPLSEISITNDKVVITD